MSSATVRTRFAPSPTGFMHVGNLRTALYEYLVAKSQGGHFVLRIEDTDQARQVDGATDIIYQTLAECGLKHDEGPDIGGPYAPYVQSERLNDYRRIAEQLVAEGKAYYCFCTQDRLSQVKADGDGFTGYDRHCRDLTPETVSDLLSKGTPYVIRQKMPLDGQTTFSDCVYGDITVDNTELEDQILLKSDGFPTYNFANVIDDHAMGITHVVRGSEYLSSTPKYNLLYEALGYPVPTYIHLPLILGEDGQKLSKRHGATSFQDLVAEGYLPEVIINYIALLGWSPTGEQEIFSLAELVETFHIEGISKSPAVFDYKKLTWFNGEYIRRMPLETFAKAIQPFLVDALPNLENRDLLVLAQMLQPRINTYQEIPHLVAFLNTPPTVYDPELYVHKKMKTTLSSALEPLERLYPLIADLTTWNIETIHDFLIQTASDWGVKNGQVMWPLRIALSGLGVTPGGAVEILYLLGKTQALARIQHGIQILQDNRSTEA